MLRQPRPLAVVYGDPDAGPRHVVDLITPPASPPEDVAFPPPDLSATDADFDWAPEPQPTSYFNGSSDIDDDRPPLRLRSPSPQPPPRSPHREDEFDLPPTAPHSPSNDDLAIDLDALVVPRQLVDWANNNDDDDNDSSSNSTPTIEQMQRWGPLSDAEAAGRPKRRRVPTVRFSHASTARCTDPPDELLEEIGGIVFVVGNPSQPADRFMLHDVELMNSAGINGVMFYGTARSTIKGPNPPEELCVCKVVGSGRAGREEAQVGVVAANLGLGLATTNQQLRSGCRLIVTPACMYVMPTGFSTPATLANVMQHMPPNQRRERHMGAQLVALYNDHRRARFRQPDKPDRVFVHNDLHQNNIIWHGANQRWYFIDCGAAALVDVTKISDSRVRRTIASKGIDAAINTIIINDWNDGKVVKHMSELCRDERIECPLV